MQDFKITVVLKNVGPGDIETLVDYLEEQGESFDAARGEYEVFVSSGNADRNSWFSYDPDDES